MPDWSALHPLRGDRRYAFEELAYQIAKVLYPTEGRFVRVDDSGGGDGVEFYIKRGDDTEWGWQTKLFPAGRLSQSGRKNQIAESLRKACEVHPNLRKWILCTPMNFTTLEQTWFDTTLPQEVPPGRAVEIEHWSDSNFTAWLAEPQFFGKNLFFFGDLEFNLEWFKSQFEKQTAGLKDRFTPGLHIETQIDDIVHNLLGDKEFGDYAVRQLSLIDERIDELKEAVLRVEQAPFPEIKWGTARDELALSSAQLLGAINCMRGLLSQSHSCLASRDFTAIRGIHWASAEKPLTEALDSYIALAEDRSPYKLDYQGDTERRDSTVWRAYKTIIEPANLVEVLRDEMAAVRQQFRFLEESELHIFGTAGVGKTHLSCHICQQRLQNNLPALYVRGIRFRSNETLENQLRAVFDVPPSWAWGDFVHALASAAEAYETKIPLVIDGLNEAVHHGRFSSVWETDLPGIAVELANAGHLALVTTCRSTYRTAVWGTDGPTNQLTLTGLDIDDVEQAIEKYFEWYKITADITLASLRQFQLPIYLKLFCEITNPTRANEKEAYVGQQSLFEVFDEYLAQCNEAVSRRLAKRPEAKVAINGLTELAAFMWENESRVVALDRAFSIIDGQPLKEVNVATSISENLLSEGLLIERDLLEGEEGIQFTYDLLGGCVIASYLLDANRDNILKFLLASETMDKLFGDDPRQRHPLGDDIGRSLAALLPRFTQGTYLHELIEFPRALQLSLRALFEISPQSINQQAVDYVAGLFTDESMRRELFELATATMAQVGHPLNAEFWSKQLKSMSLADRDLSWTEYVRRNIEMFDRLALQLETASQGPLLTAIAEGRAHLIASLLRWCLTSTTPRLRDHLTKALYFYSRRWSNQHFELLRDSIPINDPYIGERMLAVTYGMVMARQFEFPDASFANDLLPKLATFVYASMFAPNAAQSTTHFLSRDYAWRTIKIALNHRPDLLSADEMKRTLPPFLDGGIRAWGKRKEQGRRGYRDGNHPLSRNHHGPLEGPMEALGPVSRNPQSSKYRLLQSNLWWRIHDLGYSVDRFGDVDAAIMRARPEVGWGLEPWLTNPYGRKYALIAAYELAGYLDDLGALRFDPKESQLSERPSFVDLNPSFPVEPQQCDVEWVDLLGDLEIPSSDWVKARYDPNVEGYFGKDTICGQYGPWVLLAAHLVEQEPSPGRDVFFYTVGVIASVETAPKLISKMRRRRKSIRSEARTPATTYTFAGEIPWSDTYPESDLDIFSFPAGSVPVERLVTETDLWRDGKPLPKDETSEILRSLFEQAFREKMAARNSESDIDARIAEMADNRGFQIKTVEVIETHNEPIYEELVTCPHCLVHAL